MISPAQIMWSSSYLSSDAGTVNISDKRCVDGEFKRAPPTKMFYLIHNILFLTRDPGTKTNIVCVQRTHHNSCVGSRLFLAKSESTPLTKV